MNCKPGEMAIVTKRSTLVHEGFEMDAVRAGTPVTVQTPMGTTPESWLLEEPISFRLTFPCGCVMSGKVFDYFDNSLMPIRDPGADAVDQMVKLVGPKRMTLAEIKQWSAA